MNKKNVFGPSSVLLAASMLFSSVAVAQDEECPDGDCYGGGSECVVSECPEGYINTNPGVCSVSECVAIEQEPTSVPEPETLALLGIGIAGLLLARRRKG